VVETDSSAIQGVNVGGVDMTSLTWREVSLSVNQSLTTNEMSSNNSLIMMSTADWTNTSVVGGASDVSGINRMTTEKVQQSNNNNNNNIPPVTQNGNKAVIGCDVTLLVLLFVLSFANLL